MKFTLSWLKEHLDTDADLKTITDKLTAIGLEVEDVVDNSKALAPFIIAYVESAEQHPNADRLKVCKVNDNHQTYQIVCGAPNARAGMKAVLSLPGMVIPSTGEALKKGAIRGVESQGMMCSAAELGLGVDSAGIIELPADAPVGAPYAKTYGLDDAVIEINLTPNRADCTGIYGIARDLAAAGLGKLKPISMPKINPANGQKWDVKIETPDCPQFASCLIKGVKNASSPEWLQSKLRAIGLRPISALVDITNYFTIVYGRPMHVFDVAKLRGAMRVHPAKGGEKIAALNDKEYQLQPGMTAISDDSGVISVAGIVGGASTGVDENTKDVLLEVALWNPDRIAETGRKLECITDARYRFERGVDPEFVKPSLDLATKMILDLCGGNAGEPVVTGKTPEYKRQIEFRASRIKSLGGADLPASSAQDILAKLGFQVADSGKEIWAITPPSWRGDVHGEADIVEEIIRLIGFDNIPAASLPMGKIEAGQALSASQKRIALARRALAVRGMLQSTSFAFVSREQAELFGDIKTELTLKNPIASDLNYMRPSILPSLLQMVKSNADRSNPDLAIFEIGPQYAGVKPEDQKIVAAAIRSGVTPRHWQEKSRKVNAFDAKADALALLAELGVDASKGQITAGAPEWYHPGQSGVVKFGPNILAQFGVLHPKILAHYDIKLPVVAAEIFLENIPAPKSKSGKARTLLKLSPFQPVSRDFAFLVDQSVSADAVIRAARDADKNLIVDVYVFDEFRFKKDAAIKDLETEKAIAEASQYPIIDMSDSEFNSVAKDKKFTAVKSIAIAVTMQPADKTLTDAEIEAVCKKIVDSVIAATGGTLRT
ncbi:MAG: phenylalanine--tRNA ligase subunit beta [Alphaproteobacteria bacterium]|nr:MAG: phenylalanine--tRNA ligase subunit beta [Alphaproteobacteria bacterium]